MIMKSELEYVVAYFKVLSPHPPWCSETDWKHPVRMSCIRTKF